MGRLRSPLHGRNTALPPGFIPGLELVQVVAVGAIAGKTGFIKQALNATPQTNPVGASLNAERPAHLTVPAATHHDHGGAGNPSGDDSSGPEPTQPALFRLYQAGFPGRIDSTGRIGIFDRNRTGVFYCFHNCSIRRKRACGNSSMGPKVLPTYTQCVPRRRCRLAKKLVTY